MGTHAVGGRVDVIADTGAERQVAVVSVGEGLAERTAGLHLDSRDGARESVQVNVAMCKLDTNNTVGDRFANITLRYR